jgi:galactofuranosylgalactofuranosylrhamnosyl-N-acetylglucosaminyl-diphospho-decaprenol beta-1,5/1,6-galactofuranosyltransferase
MRHFCLNKLNGDILGLVLYKQDSASRFLEGTYYEDFSCWQNQRLRAAICTYRREKYMMRTMYVLENLIDKYSWMDVLIIDNGSTLHKYTKSRKIRVIQDRNYGGSGGFTRGMLEYMQQGKINYILLMDDIILEPLIVVGS